MECECHIRYMMCIKCVCVCESMGVVVKMLFWAFVGWFWLFVRIRMELGNSDRILEFGCENG